MWKYRNVRTYLQKAVLQIAQKKFVINKVKNTVPWTYVKEDLYVEKPKTRSFLERFIKNNCKKQPKRVQEWKSNKEKRWPIIF